MDYKIGEMLTVGGKFGDVIGEQNGLPIVFLLREKESIIADPAKHNVQRLGGSKKVASKKMALEGDPPKGADDTALKLWSMGYRGKALEDQMAALGFTEAQTRKAVEMAQTEYRARREDGGGRWEILEPGERVKLASGEWGKVVKVGDPMQVRFADGKVEPVQMSDLDDLFVSGRLVIARIDRLIADVEEELGLEGDFTVQYTIPGANPDKKKFNSDRDAADFVEDLLKQHGPNVQIMLPVKQTLRTAVPTEEWPTEEGEDPSRYVEEPPPARKIQPIKLEEPTKKSPEEMEERWDWPGIGDKQKMVIKRPDKKLKEQEDEIIKPLEYALAEKAKEIRGLYEKLEQAEKAATAAKAQASQITMGPVTEEKKVEKELRSKYEDFMAQIRSLEGKAAAGKNILREYENMIILIKSQIKRTEGQPLSPKPEQMFKYYLFALAGADSPLDAKALDFCAATADALFAVRQGAEEFIELEPKIYVNIPEEPKKKSSKIEADWKSIREWFGKMWDKIRDLGRMQNEAELTMQDHTDKAEELELAVDEMLMRASARVALGGK